MDLAPGTVIDESIEIISAIGVGGFGTVYKARQLAFDRIVALKILHPDSLADEPDAQARFEREAKVLSTFRHKNVVGLYGFGYYMNAPYMVLEYLQGKSLDVVLEKEQSLDPNRAVSIIEQVCEGLSAAHAAGILHRDLKPSNIILVLDDSGQETVKLIDFGLAKEVAGVGESRQKLTETGRTVGTCFYMSPEQCLGQAVDARADVYSAGCTLYECLAGRRPFEGINAANVMYQHVNEHPPPIAETDAGARCNPKLQNLMNRALAKDVKSRYQSAEEMRAELAPFDGRAIGGQVGGWSKRKAKRSLSRVPMPVLLVSMAVILTGLLVLCMLMAPTPAPEKAAKPMQDEMIKWDDYEFLLTKGKREKKFAEFHPDDPASKAKADLAARCFVRAAELRRQYISQTAVVVEAAHCFWLAEEPQKEIDILLPEIRLVETKAKRKYDPAYSDSVRLLADAYRRVGEPIEERKFLEKFLQYERGHRQSDDSRQAMNLAFAHFYLGANYVHAGRVDKGMALIEQAKEEAQGNQRLLELCSNELASANVKTKMMRR